MADTYNKKEREKKKRKRKQDKAERKEQRKLAGKTTPEFVYLDENGNYTSTPPDPSKKKKIKAEDIRVSTPKKEELEDNDPIRRGIVKFFNEEKGYGFIKERGSEQSYFVHIDNLIDQIKSHDKVTFEIGSGPRGPIAVNVKMAT